MNFYVGDSINEINYEIDDEGAFSAEFDQYLYQRRDIWDINMDVIFSIDSYADEVVDNKDVLQIIAICEYILANSLGQEYAISTEDDDPTKDIEKVILICKSALEQGKGLVSIGD